MDNEGVETSELSLAQHFNDVVPLQDISMEASHDTPAAVRQSTPISKYLTPYNSTPSCKRKAPPRARLLTSAAAMEMLLEKERKKQQEAELKEKRKKEREEAKKKKEEQQKKRLEERAAKAELKVKKAAQREEKTRRAEPKESKATRRRGDKEPQNSVPAKRACIEMRAQDVINDNECCVCFVAYEDDTSGTDWVECACGRWLHEDCADDCVIDEGGNERLCFVCLNVICK